MPTSEIQVAFTNQPADAGDSENTVDTYWVRISQAEQKEVSPSMGSVANLIDSIYGYHPDAADSIYDRPEAIVNIEGNAPEDNLARQRFYWDKVREYANLGLCDVEPSGDYNTQITVELSHAEGDYNLRLTNGKITQTVLTATTAADKINADTPARVYLVDVTVFGNGENEPGDCRAICFYQYTTDEIYLIAPGTDDATESDRDKYCPSYVWEIQEWEDEITCYETVTTQYKCECGGDLAYETVEEVTVSCPDDRNFKCLHQFSNWSSPYTDDDGNWVPGKWYCRYNMGDRTVLGGYIPCDIVLYDPMGVPRSRWEDKSVMSEAWYYEERCCVTPNGNLPKCQTTYRKNPGDGKIDETRLSNYKARYGDKLDLIPVSPEDGDCGTIKTVISDTALSCCEFVTPLVWDAESSAEVVADNSSTLVYFTGGRAPFKVSVRGSGFYLDSSRTKRDGVFNYHDIRIYTGQACGFCIITIDDGCTTARGGIRAANGRWEQFYPDFPFCLGGTVDCTISTASAECIAISGELKHRQYSLTYGKSDYAQTEPGTGPCVDMSEYFEGLKPEFCEQMTYWNCAERPGVKLCYIEMTCKRYTESCLGTDTFRWYRALFLTDCIRDDEYWRWVC